MENWVSPLIELANEALGHGLTKLKKRDPSEWTSKTD